MALAWVRERPAGVPPLLREVAATPGACWSLALAGYWLGTTEQGGPYGLAGPTAAQALFKHLLFLVIATLLLVPAVFGEPSARWHRLAVRPLWRWFGQISFGVFLWHPMLLDAIRLLLGLPAFGGGFWLTLVLTLAASILAAAISWK